LVNLNKKSSKHFNIPLNFMLDENLLTVVIVNYRTPDLTIDCLHSLESEVRSLPGTQVIVTDNDSSDTSVEQISTAIATQNWSEWVTFMPLERNGGFAYGNNAAIRPLLAGTNPPSYILLLNPDTIVHPGALQALVDFMEKHPDVGIAGSRLEDPDGTPQESAFRFHTVMSELDQGFRLGILSKLLNNWQVAPPVSQETCQTDWVAGASMIVRAKCLRL
jgi:GT2 family glycosyltransferase